MTVCPYCESEIFEAESPLYKKPTVDDLGHLNNDAQWLNTCHRQKGCGKQSIYDEATDTQLKIE